MGFGVGGIVALGALQQLFGRLSDRPINLGDKTLAAMRIRHDTALQKQVVHLRAIPTLLFFGIVPDLLRQPKQGQPCATLSRLTRPQRHKITIENPGKGDNLLMRQGFRLLSVGLPYECLLTHLVGISDFRQCRFFGAKGPAHDFITEDRAEIGRDALPEIVNRGLGMLVRTRHSQSHVCHLSVAPNSNHTLDKAHLFEMKREKWCC